MPTEIKNDPRRDFARRFLPWLVAAAMLAVYLCTINHWVSLINLDTVARKSGWIWVPDLSFPVYHIVTLPVQILPKAMIPLALNLFSAVCAAVVLGLLTRSAGILPHDRTDPQAVRERNDFALLTICGAWLPPLLAALLCGLQLTFWEHATNGDAMMFDLLLYAVVVWLLLEHRLDGREWRLYASSVIVGAGVAEGMSMTGFFPLFVVAIIWARGFSFFDKKFLGRMLFCGFLGFLFFLPLPVMAVISGKLPLSFFGALKLSLEPQYHVLRAYFQCVSNLSTYFENAVMPLFVALVPLLVMSIRWKINDSSKLGSVLASLMFHSIHAIFLGVCIWLAFDPPFSPREKGFGLTLYFFIALSVGYYAGYFLLIFGRKHPKAGEFQPGLVKLLNMSVVLGVWALAILAITGLVYKNGPLIHGDNGDMLQRYASLVTESLPDKNTMVLSDDPQRTFLTEAALVRTGRAQNFLFLNSELLLYPQYHVYLHQIAPQRWPLLVSPKQTNMLNPAGMVAMLNMLNQSNELYYLHPSFGYYFETFYAEPHGLVYKLKSLPKDTLLPPPPDKELIAENEAFWSSARTQALSSVESDIASYTPNSPEPFIRKQLARLHVPHEADINAFVAGSYYSRSLDFWGVELQQMGDLANAAAAFDEALKLNPGNIVAQINRTFNDTLRAGQTPVVDLSRTAPDHLGGFDSLQAAITAGGPFDDPSFCFAYGLILEQDNLLFRQAVAPLERVLKVAPNLMGVRMHLARLYGINHLPDRILQVLQAPLEHPDNFSLEPVNEAQMNVLAAAAYFQKNDVQGGSRLFKTAISDDPTNDMMLVTIARVYMSRSMYTDALAVADHRLSSSPGDPNWLFVKGYIDLQLKKYDEAITLLNNVLAVQKDNADALLQRGNAYLDLDKLEDARRDYAQLQQLNTNSLQAAYGLGEVAWRQHDTNEAVRNYEIFMASAPTNVAEYQTVAGRLQELKQPAGGK